MRQGLIIAVKTNQLKEGDNILVNRSPLLNNNIWPEWLNLTYMAVKLKVKGLFLSQ